VVRPARIAYVTSRQPGIKRREPTRGTKAGGESSSNGDKQTLMECGEYGDPTILRSGIVYAMEGQINPRLSRASRMQDECFVEWLRTPSAARARH